MMKTTIKKQRASNSDRVCLKIDFLPIACAHNFHLQCLNNNIIKNTVCRFERRRPPIIPFFAGLFCFIVPPFKSYLLKPSCLEANRRRKNYTHKLMIFIDEKFIKTAFFSCVRLNICFYYFFYLHVFVRANLKSMKRKKNYYNENNIKRAIEFLFDEQ